MSSLDEVTSNSEKIKHVALSVVGLCWPEASGRKKLMKYIDFHRNLLEELGFILKAVLVMNTAKLL